MKLQKPLPKHTPKIKKNWTMARWTMRALLLHLTRLSKKYDLNIVAPHWRTDSDHNEDVIILRVRPVPQLTNACRATSLHWSRSMQLKNTPNGLSHAYRSRTPFSQSINYINCFSIACLHLRNKSFVNRQQFQHLANNFCYHSSFT